MTWYLKEHRKLELQIPRIKLKYHLITYTIIISMHVLYINGCIIYECMYYIAMHVLYIIVCTIYQYM